MSKTRNRNSNRNKSSTGGTFSSQPKKSQDGGTKSYLGFIESKKFVEGDPLGLMVKQGMDQDGVLGRHRKCLVQLDPLMIKL